MQAKERVRRLEHGLVKKIHGFIKSTYTSKAYYTSRSYLSVSACVFFALIELIKKFWFVHCRCMYAAGVIAGDSRDQNNTERFIIRLPEEHFFPNPKSFYRPMMYYKSNEGLGFASKYSIAFHYIAPNHLYALYYLVYRLRVYGIRYRYPPLPRNLNFSHVKHVLQQERLNLSI